MKLSYSYSKICTAEKPFRAFLLNDAFYARPLIVIVSSSNLSEEYSLLTFTFIHFFFIIFFFSLVPSALFEARFLTAFRGWFFILKTCFTDLAIILYYSDENIIKPSKFLRSLSSKLMVKS